MVARAFWSLLVLMTVLSTELASASPKRSGSATDAAFAALLAMPGTQPLEGGWIIPPQDTPTPRNETQLIRRLQALKNLGADFDAMRHKGTLLAHAIRAGKERTAIWLLDQGATTQHVVFGSGESAYQIAQKYRRTAVTKVLEAQPGFQPTPPDTHRLSATHAAPAGQPVQTAVPDSPRARARQLLEKQPERYAPKQDQLAWQALAPQLSPADLHALVVDGQYLAPLLRLVGESPTDIEAVLSQLPQELIRRHAQVVADVLQKGSFVTYGEGGTRSYTAMSRAWPALWRRIAQPLDYSQRPDLVERIPPERWSDLFGSGYSNHRLSATGCLLSALDAETFRALWPSIERHFPDAGEMAPSLVLESYQLSSDQRSCYYSSTSTQTAEKLRFLRTRNVPGRVFPLSERARGEALDPGLVAAAQPFISQPTKSRLVPVGLDCTVDLGSADLDALIKANMGAWESVQAIDIPDQQRCALFFSTETYGYWGPAIEDDFDQGPFQNGRPSCPDPPGHGVYWVHRNGKLQAADLDEEYCGYSCVRQKVQDTETKSVYWLYDSGPTVMCAPFPRLPSVYMWGLERGRPKPIEVPAGDPVVQLLRAQCSMSDDDREVVCRNLGAISEAQEARSVTASEPGLPAETTLERLRTGHGVAVFRLVDELGSARRRDYAKAIAALDRASLRRLASQGIPHWWTHDELLQLSAAPISLEKKRRRAALLFADHEQMARVFDNPSRNLLESLLGWLPDQDWEPVLGHLRRNPDTFREALDEMKDAFEKAHRSQALTCRIDHALGHLCGGGITRP